MGREWSLQTVANLRFRKLEKTLIEVYGCMLVDYKRVVRLDVRKGRPMVQPESHLGFMENMIIEVYGCMPQDKQVVDLGLTRERRKTVVKVVYGNGEFLQQSAPCA